jgi:SAM-dependent methyltransferase
MSPVGLDDALARLYDVDLMDDPGDLDLYLALAARAGGPILELAVGTGRLAVPLASAGFEVTGVDLDPAMLERAARRAEAAGPAVARRLRLVEGDARSVRLPEAGTFAMAFVALNSLLIVGGRSDQTAVLRTMKAHLDPAGIGVVDVWLPDAEDLARYDGRLGLEYVRRDPESGRLVAKLASARHDAATATVELTGIYDEGDPGEPPVRWVRRDDLRLVGAIELQAMAEAVGLTVEVLAGAYDLRRLSHGDDRAVLVTAARRRRSRSGAGGPPPRV